MRIGLALAAIACYGAHASVHLWRGEPYDLLWGCHLAVLLVAAGLLLRNATLNGVGVLWSCFGLPIWLLYTFTGGEFMPTATLTHLGALIIGTTGVRILGWPRGAAWKAMAGYVALWIMTRLATPETANINLAFRVYPGWEGRFATYPLYFATLFFLGVAIFTIADALFRHIAGPARPARAAA
jgi:hypothetical protein